ncbi:hypothetical protein [Actinoallomurus rhizosphaericola]|uniref:hypothetical protein n=1 Tax=Actinoallomurus rhizosphaericola TaxID=2952536 RepID=UPI002093420C|nr:hypothetical protein [Actinoallomurus rhizosphaericola]MCO5998246.1 hypothetical protein [Actinoallomurus rhizosphaericola]
MRAKTARRPLALIGFGLFMTLGMSMNTGAEAEQYFQGAQVFALPGDNNHIANGHHNVSNSTIRSPTRLHGIQQVADANALARVGRNNAICRKRRFCNIQQRVVIIGR